MIALIQHEVVEENTWMTAQEFTDVVATSQVTPGPVGINTATYAGYTAVVNAGYAEWMGVLGAFLASFSVILLPFLLMLLVSRFLLRHRDHYLVEKTLFVLRLAIVGLIAAAALSLVSVENFGSPQGSKGQIVCSSLIFLGAFAASYKFKISPILLILLSGLVGFFLYGLT